MPRLTIEVAIAESGDLDASAQRIGQRIRQAANSSSGGGVGGQGGGIRGGSNGGRSALNVVGLPAASEVEQEGERVVSAASRVQQRLKGLVSGADRDLFRSFGLPFGVARGLGGLVSGAGLGAAAGVAAIGAAAYIEYRDAQAGAVARRSAGARLNQLGIGGAEDLANQFTPSPTGSISSFFNLPRNILPGARSAFAINSLDAASRLSPSTRGVELSALDIQEIAGRSGNEPSAVGEDISSRFRGRGLRPQQTESALPNLTLSALLAQRENAGVSTYPSFLANAPTARSELSKGLGAISAAETGNEREQFRFGQRQKNTQAFIARQQAAAESEAEGSYRVRQAQQRTAEAQNALTDDPNTIASSRRVSALDRQNSALQLLDQKQSALQTSATESAVRASEKERNYRLQLKRFLQERQGEPIANEAGFQSAFPQARARVEKAKQFSQDRANALADFAATKSSEADKIRGISVEDNKLIEIERQVAQRETDLSNVRAIGSTQQGTRNALFDIPGRTRAERFSQQLGDISLSRQSLEAEISRSTPQEAGRLGLRRGVLDAEQQAAIQSQNISTGEDFRTGRDSTPGITARRQSIQRQQDEARGARIRAALDSNVVGGTQGSTDTESRLFGAGNTGGGGTGGNKGTESRLADFANAMNAAAQAAHNFRNTVAPNQIFQPGTAPLAPGAGS